MEEEEARVQSALDAFGATLNDLEEKTRLVLGVLDEIKASDDDQQVPPLLRARVDASLAYAMNTMFCLYLRTQGLQPSSHPVREEIDRVHDAFVRIHAIEHGKYRKPRKRVLASLHDAERELSSYLTEGEKLIHKGMNGRVEQPTVK